MSRVSVDESADELTAGADARHCACSSLLNSRQKKNVERKQAEALSFFWRWGYKKKKGAGLTRSHMDIKESGVK